MNGKNQNLLSCVGAMKIARNLAVSERHIEWYSRPGSLREGAGKRPPHNANHPPAGCFVSGRVIFWGSVWGVPFNRVLAKPWGYGRFSSPLRNSEVFTFHHSSDDSSLREGAGNGLYHSMCRSEAEELAGDFHRPYERLGNLSPFTVHWGGRILGVVPCRAYR